MMDAKTVVSPKNKGWQMLPLCCLPWLTGPEHDATVCKSSLADKKGVKEQKVAVNCSLPMPIESISSASFRKS